MFGDLAARLWITSDHWALFRRVYTLTAVTGSAACGKPYIDALYFTVATQTTTVFGDVTLDTAAAWSKSARWVWNSRSPSSAQFTLGDLEDQQQHQQSSEFGDLLVGAKQVTSLAADFGTGQ